MFHTSPSIGRQFDHIDTKRKFRVLIDWNKITWCQLMYFLHQGSDIWPIKFKECIFFISHKAIQHVGQGKFVWEPSIKDYVKRTFTCLISYSSHFIREVSS